MNQPRHTKKLHHSAFCGKNTGEKSNRFFIFYHIRPHSAPTYAPTVSMTQPEINFLDIKDKLLPAPRRRMSWRLKIILSLVLVVGIVGVTLGIGVLSSGEHLSKAFGNLGLWGQFKHLIGNEDRQLNGESQDRINVLLLGIGGEGHDGPFLSDTIIIASIKPSTGKVALLSVPRDLFVPIPGYGWKKINHADAYGEAQNQGDGPLMASQVVGHVFGVPIHYFIRVDFDGFQQLIDDLGGVDVDVDATLDDNLYPVKGKENATTSQRYEHLYIEAGRHHFDGTTALKYVRSREGRGVEGSDFARSRRQQKVLLAVKQKLLGLGTLANPYRITRIMDNLSQHLSSNLEVWEMLKLFTMAKNVTSEDITTKVFDASSDGPLYSTMTIDGAAILQPRSGDFSELQLIAQNIFGLDALADQQPKRLEVQNGTKIPGLGLRTSQYLEGLGYKVVETRNAPTQDYQKTVVYVLTQSPKSTETASILAKLLGADVAPTLPTWVSATTSAQVSRTADILIILGQDRKEL